MDFEKVIASVTASILIVLRRFILLIFTPYQTIRKISEEKDNFQVFIILLLVFIYFLFRSFLRQDNVSVLSVYLIFLINFSATILFFFTLSKLSDKKTKLSSFIFTFSYSLLPTLIWFIADSLFFYFLPPPRTTSILGKSFSIFFIAFSLSLLFWKSILLYLSVRFSAKQNFYRVIYHILLYLCLLTPYSYLLYFLRVFRIPFI